MMLNLISPAFASSSAPTAGFSVMQFVPILLIFAVVYILLLRPQQKKMQQQKEMLASLARGDQVLTSGGIIGTISKIVSDQEVLVDIAEGVQVRLARPMIAEKLQGTRSIVEMPQKPAHPKAESSGESAKTVTPITAARKKPSKTTAKKK